MSDDRFAPPSAEVFTPEAAPQVPDAVLKKIRLAWMAGLFSSAVTLVLVLLALSGTSLLGFGMAELVDVALMLGLTFGIYKKSRTCAVLMLLYFLLSKFFLFQQGAIGAGSAVSALLFVYFYVQGVIGTFAYHKHLKQKLP